MSRTGWNWNVHAVSIQRIQEGYRRAGYADEMHESVRAELGQPPWKKAAVVHFPASVLPEYETGIR